MRRVTIITAADTACYERVYILKQYSAKNLKNIALAGHGGSGKTSLAEAMLYLSKASDRLGKVADGNTVLDFDSEEKKRKVSVSTAVAPLEWNGDKINLIDTPGLFDFAGGLYEGMRAADAALIVLSGKSGVTVGAHKAFKAAGARGLPRLFFIGKLDSEHADYNKVLDELISTFGAGVCPVVTPHVVNHKVEYYVNLVSGKAFTYQNGKPAETTPDLSLFEDRIAQLDEAVAGMDEELMEKFFDAGSLTPEERARGLKDGLRSGELMPVFCGAGGSVQGIDLLLDGLQEYLPPAAEIGAERATDAKGETVELSVSDDGPLAAIVFKTIADPFIGKLSYFKVVSGKLTSDSQVVNARTGSAERIGKVLVVRGGKQEDAPYIGAGDIGAVGKLAGAVTGDTLTSQSRPLTLEPIAFPAACLSMAVSPKNKGDEDKIVAGLGRLAEEDPTIRYEQNHETHELILSGLGEQHLDVVASKLKNKFGVDVVLSVPKVAYRETIRKKVKVQGRHKKQSGGHGQFGDVWIEFEPCDSDELVFEEKVFGGSVPKNFFPAVEKGLRDSMAKGLLAGYPVVGVKATLVDGSYHPVDSSEMSFKTAASLAFKAGFPTASPVLLEPIGHLKAVVPDDNMGDIIGDINKRRGRVLGMNPAEDGQEIEAEVPMAEMGDFATVLRSITQGRGSFTMAFERYEDAPPQVAQKVMEESKANGNVE